MVTVRQHEIPDSEATTPLTPAERANEHLRTLDRMIRLTGLADTKAAP